MMASMQVHFGLSGGWWPNQDIKYRQPTAWAPRLPIRFDQLVDHISQVTLHRTATPTLVRACCEALGVPREREDHARPRRSQVGDGPAARPRSSTRPPTTPGDRHDRHLLLRVRRAVAPRLPDRHRRPGRHQHALRLHAADRLGERRGARPVHDGGLVAAWRRRRVVARRSARGSPVLPGPPADRDPRRHAARQGQHVRAPPQPGAPRPAVERREARRRPGHRAPCPQPLPLRGHGGGRGRRPRFLGAGGLAEPAHRHRRRRVARCRRSVSAAASPRPH